MKSFKYTLMFLASLAVVSCAKQEVGPTENVDAFDVPTWRSSETGEGDTGEDIIEGAGILDPDDDESVTDGDDVIDGNGILDPENDPNKKKKKAKE